MVRLYSGNTCPGEGKAAGPTLSSCRTSLTEKTKKELVMNKAFRLAQRTWERGSMSKRRISLVLLAVFSMASLPGWSQDWPQWGRTPQHTGAVNVSGQHTKKLL